MEQRERGGMGGTSSNFVTKAEGRKRRRKEEADSGGAGISPQLCPALVRSLPLTPRITLDMHRTFILRVILPTDWTPCFEHTLQLTEREKATTQEKNHNS